MEPRESLRARLNIAAPRAQRRAALKGVHPQGASLRVHLPPALALQRADAQRRAACGPGGSQKGGLEGGEFAYQTANAVIFFIVITIVSVIQFKGLGRKDTDF